MTRSSVERQDVNHACHIETSQRSQTIARAIACAFDIPFHDQRCPQPGWLVIPSAQRVARSREVSSPAR